MAKNKPSAPGRFRREAKRLKEWVRSHSNTWQLTAGALLALFSATLYVAISSNKPSVSAAIGALFMAVACFSAGWLMSPWFRALPRKTQRRITTLPTVCYLAVAFLFVLVCGLVATYDRSRAATLLMDVWVLHPVLSSMTESSEFAYERLRGRLGRAAVMRVTVIWCGMAGMFLLLQEIKKQSDYRAAVLAATVTLTLTAVAASRRVLVRVRRLRTSLDEKADTLIIELEKLRLLPVKERDEQRQTVEGAWRNLRRVLLNKIDAGFTPSVVSVLPSSTLRELQDQVHRAQRASGTDFAAHRAAIARLRMLRMACARGTDTLA